MEGAGEGASTVASVVARSRIPVPWGFVCPARRGFAGFESKPTTGHVFGWGGRAGVGSTPCCDSKGHARACRTKTHKRERERKVTCHTLRSDGALLRKRCREYDDERFLILRVLSRELKEVGGEQNEHSTPQKPQRAPQFSPTREKKMHRAGPDALASNSAAEIVW